MQLFLGNSLSCEGRWRTEYLNSRFKPSRHFWHAHSC